MISTSSSFDRSLIVSLIDKYLAISTVPASFSEMVIVAKSITTEHGSQLYDQFY